MLNTLNTGIYNKLRAASGLTSLLATSTSIYHVVAPAQAALPYLVYRCIDDRRKEVFGSPYFEDTDYQFDVWTESPANAPSALVAGNIFAQLIATMDDASLTVSGATQVSIERTLGSVMYEQETERFRATARYRIVIQE